MQGLTSLLARWQDCPKYLRKGYTYIRLLIVGMQGIVVYQYAIGGTGVLQLPRSWFMEKPT